MSWGSLSQFSPNFEQPMPTMATLSRMAFGFMAISSAHRRALPVVVRRPARVVHLPEDELDGEVELHLLRARIGHLEVESRALDIDHGRDEGRARAAGEVVEGEGLERPDLVREAHALEVVAREAAEADGLARELEARPAPAAETGEGRVGLAVAAGIRGRRAGSAPAA